MLSAINPMDEPPTVDPIYTASEGLNDTSWHGYFGQFIDMDYTIWLWRVLKPLLAVLILPQILTLLLYLSAFILHIYKLHRRIILQAINSNQVEYWVVAQKLISSMWDAHASIYHGYEVHGLEDIPETGAALIICYHGAWPVDMYYLIARVCRTKNRLIHTVGDNFVFKVPGWSDLTKAFGITPGTIQSCIQTLQDGHLLQIAPGGVYEAQFGDHFYELLWKDRKGFAKVAIGAKCPIIPMFTENIREAFRQVGFLNSFFLKIYDKLKLPLRPVYGGFPVKLRTYLGKPIEYDPSYTPEELRKRVALAIEEIIQREQRLPGSILYALFDRVMNYKKYKQS